MIVLSHLGLGDALICNGLFRALARTHNTISIPAKPHNVASVAWMLSDVANITVFPIVDDGFMEVLRNADEPKLGLGYYASEPFDRTIFDQEFYRQAGVAFSERWDGWALPQVENDWSKPGEFSFIHQDVDRGYVINKDKLPAIPSFVPLPNGNLFLHMPALQAATEIHCINSVFAILADSVPLKATKLVLHAYARDGELPTFRKSWTVLR